jgi:hypothetical protein
MWLQRWQQCHIHISLLGRSRVWQVSVDRIPVSFSSITFSVPIGKKQVSILDAAQESLASPWVAITFKTSITKEISSDLLEELWEASYFNLVLETCNSVLGSFDFCTTTQVRKRVELVLTLDLPAASCLHTPTSHLDCRDFSGSINITALGIQDLSEWRHTTALMILSKSLSHSSWASIFLFYKNKDWTTFF